ncbi:unnamed protein product [Rodentolepis nana]|uniref:Secreted protein n=1 Tax=Rodentolepis nana TaxID=102285 RepID=A0A0R3U0U4_RODNA|nr:unnamed protein product [Rodentolepis nana]
MVIQILTGVILLTQIFFSNEFFQRFIHAFSPDSLFDIGACIKGRLNGYAIAYKARVILFNHLCYFTWN